MLGWINLSPIDRLSNVNVAASSHSLAQALTKIFIEDDFRKRNRKSGNFINKYRSTDRDILHSITPAVIVK